MDSTLDAALRSWPVEPWLAIGLIAGGLIYTRGWMILRRRLSWRWNGSRLAAFWGGLATIYLALASPIEAFAPLLLSVHMVQHVVLMMVAPPLIWLGAPLFPLIRGLPEPIRVYWVGPLLRWRWLRRLANWLTRPVPALALFAGATWFWHWPGAYELALRSSGWHFVEHACFLATGLLFWFPVVRSYPRRGGMRSVESRGGSPSLTLRAGVGALAHTQARSVSEGFEGTGPTALRDGATGCGASSLTLCVGGDSEPPLLALRARGNTASDWILLPYLIFADLQNTLLAALLAFSHSVIYPYYAQMPRLGGISAIADQQAAGVIMWVPGSIAYLVPLFVIGVRLLYGRPRSAACSAGVPACNGLARGLHAGEDACTTRRFDVLRVPVIGRFLKWRHARVTVQLPMLLLAALAITDGLRGPQVGAMNLAGVLPWIHWRGFLILSLLVLGNVFCMACPFMLPRTLGRKLFGARWNWPRWLRSKWLAAGLVAIFLWSYEAFSLWDSPWLTAWIAIGYFVAAFAIDSLFRGAAFCKYVCPIGQFNFVQSLISPLEITVREPAVCATCTTRECIRGRNSLPLTPGPSPARGEGRRSSGGRQSGCELHLFQPRKAGNLDCTFCTDCIHACPHDNIGILVNPPAKQLWHDPLRSGIGRFSRRTDLAALVLVLVFGAFANAAGMVGPIVEFEQWLGQRLAMTSPLAIVSGFNFVAIVVLPIVLVSAAAAMSRASGKLDEGVVRTATRFSFALVPLGFSMWLAHYLFHFLSSYDTVIPAAQRFASDLGIKALGPPAWSCACCRPVADWLPRFEMLCLDFGLLLSLYTAFRIAQTATMRDAPLKLVRVLKTAAPWAMLIVVLFAAGVWIVLQPMQMRGMLPS